MSKYYRAQRVRNLYRPGLAFTISRSKLELFLECPRCFYNDRRLGVGRPPGFPFTLNSAVDSLLKREFDMYRADGKPHPHMTAHGVDAIPFAHDLLEDWRNALHKGIRFHHDATNLLITGAVDDLWINPAGELIIVDYKATAKKEAVTLDADWQISYKRQMAIYAWLFKRNGFRVSPRSYFVYCNGRVDALQFQDSLGFRVKLLAHDIDDTWVESTIFAAHACLNGTLPSASVDCDFCAYAAQLAKVATS